MEDLKKSVKKDMTDAKQEITSTATASENNTTKDLKKTKEEIFKDVDYKLKKSVDEHGKRLTEEEQNMKADQEKIMDDLREFARKEEAKLVAANEQKDEQKTEEEGPPRN